MKKVVYGTVLLLFFVFSGCLMAAESDGEEGTLKHALLMKTGQDLVDLCSVTPADPLHDRAIAFCYGFVSGAMSFYGAIADSPKVPKIVCSEEMIPRSDMVGAFLVWSGKNPEYLSEAPIDVLVRSAMAQWPCEK